MYWVVLCHALGSICSPSLGPVPWVEWDRGGIDQFELEDGYSAKLERRVGQMRDLDEMISWDDPDDVLVATLPVGFRMPDMERYTGVGCPCIHLRLYSTVMRALGLDEAQSLTLFPLSLSGMTQRCVTRREPRFLRQGSDEPIYSFISRWREKAAEMIERPIERDQMSMFLRSLHPRGRELVDHLRAMETYVLRIFSIDDLVIIPMRDHCKHPGVISHPYSIIILIQFSTTFLCILILSRCDLHFSFSFHRLVSHGMSSLVPIGDVRELILIWECLWIELLSDSELLVF
ncbi:hypothetical protein CK203_053828 [Vitis vinifera]|uniref:Aminotransferase-like plant mobile domain-containing protein n=1 Tax=Vitis vinifera TaxID=29760 RepID=A0A438GRN2_VITVI|nr:hypothetical protein CK203_053828 [Vitis vinifera]